MKTIHQWFTEYAESHQNKTNQTIHYICVPAIYFSIIGLFMSINNDYLVDFTHSNNTLLVNWASIMLIFILLFYLRLSFKVFMKMVVFSIICIIGNHHINQNFNLLTISLSIFIIAWIGQFYGHKLEGKKPSFFKDLQFLLIGPPWVFEKMFNTK